MLMRLVVVVVVVLLLLLLLLLLPRHRGPRGPWCARGRQREGARPPSGAARAAAGKEGAAALPLRRDERGRRGAWGAAVAAAVIFSSSSPQRDEHRRRAAVVAWGFDCEKVEGENERSDEFRGRKNDAPAAADDSFALSPLSPPLYTHFLAEPSCSLA
jgi:hypothetical protein